MRARTEVALKAVVRKHPNCVQLLEMGCIQGLLVIALLWGLLREGFGSNPHHLVINEVNAVLPNRMGKTEFIELAGNGGTEYKKVSLQGYKLIVIKGHQPGIGPCIEVRLPESRHLNITPEFIF